MILSRRKIKIALFPLTCRRRGRSENLFILCVFFSFLKMGKKCRDLLKLIISTRNKHTMKFETSRKLKNASWPNIVEIIAVFKPLSVFQYKC